MPALTWPEPLPRFGGDAAPAVFTEGEGPAYLERQHQRLADGTGWSSAIAELGTRPGRR